MLQSLTESRSRALLLAALLVAGLGVLLSACGGSSGSSSTEAATSAEEGEAGNGGAGAGGTETTASSESEGESKKILFELPFPCGLNTGTKQICAGAEEAGENLPAGFSFEIKTGTNFEDTQAFNSQLQTSLQLKPAGMIVFPAGPAAEAPVLNEACDQGVAVIILDSPAEGVKCESALVGADHHELGAIVGEWLVENPPTSKEVAIVTQPPGEFASTDARVKGFEEAVEEGGFEVVATGVTNLELDKTRTQVTNILTAHPNIGAIYSANGPMGEGTTQALKGNSEVMQLTLDFVPEDVALLEEGVLSAVGNQHPEEEGSLSVENMVKVLEGQTIPKEVHTKLSVVDKENAKEEGATIVH